MAEDPQMKIRLPRQLKAQIEAASSESNRTQNGEIVARLERTFIEDAERARGLAFVRNAKATTVTGMPDPDIEDRIISLEKTVLALIGNISDLQEQLAGITGSQGSKSGSG